MQSDFVIDQITQQEYKILIIGDTEGSVITEPLPQYIKIEHRKNMLDAIALATTNRFDLIAVVYGNFNGNLKSALRTLRRIRRDAKIVLLARMHEEPDAAEFIKASSNGEKIVDDYSICPVGFRLSDNSIPVQVPGSESAQIITQQKHRIEILEKLVMEDELTGIKNRRYVREFLRQIIQRAEKESLQVTLLYFDIDNFKEYNDLYGHAVGDSILKQAAVLMQKCCRKQDVVGRIGGDEFAVVFWNLPDDKNISLDELETDERRKLTSEHPAEAIMIAERFRDELNKTDMPALGAYGKGVLKISGGLARFPYDGKTAQELFEQADKALLEAKKSGKNRVYLVGSAEQQ